MRNVWVGQALGLGVGQALGLGVGQALGLGLELAPPVRNVLGEWQERKSIKIKGPFCGVYGIGFGMRGAWSVYHAVVGGASGLVCRVADHILRP